MAQGIFEVDGICPLEIQIIDKDGKTYLIKSLVAENGLELWNSRYIDLEYVQSNGTQYIDTGIQVTDDLGFEVKLCFVQGRYTNNEVFGGGSSYNNGIGLCTHGSGEIGVIKGSTEIFKGITDIYNPHTFAVIDNNGYLDNEYKGSSITKITPTDMTMTLFKHSSVLINQSLKIYYCKIYKNGQLVFDATPKYDTATGNIGFYNSVNGEFICSSTDSLLIAGPPVVSHITHLFPYGYTYRDYIYCTGQQYIDFGFNNSSNIYVETKVRKTEGDRDGHILGSSSNFTTNGIEIFIFGNTMTDSWYKNGSYTLANYITLKYEDNTFIAYKLYISCNTDTAILSSSPNYEESDRTLCLGAMNRTTGKTYFTGRIYYAVIKDDDKNVYMYLLPCTNPDNVSGMYDILNKKFYRSSSGVDFTLEAD